MQKFVSNKSKKKKKELYAITTRACEFRGKLSEEKTKITN